MPTDSVTPPEIKIDISTRQIAVIIAFAVFFSLLSVTLVWQRNFEFGVVIAHNLVYDHQPLLSIIRWITTYGLNLMELSYGLLILVTLRSGSQKLNQPVFLAVLFTGLLGGVAGDFLKDVFDRARPAIELAGQIANTYVSSSPSFPSGHATKSIGLALPFILLAPQTDRLTKYFKWLILSLAVLVCYSRIALQYHYLSDITGSIAFIAGFTFISVWMTNLLLSIRSKGEDGSKKIYFNLGLIFIALAVIFCFL